MIDLRSDTVTRPTDGMRRAMAEAEVGDDQFGEDPSINRLQEHVSALLGKEAGLWVPTGTMANQVALRTLTSPGDDVIVAAGAHVVWSETGAAAANAGVQFTELGGDLGYFDVEALSAAIKPREHIVLPPTTLMSLENTHNRAGGRVVPPEVMSAVCAKARSMNIATYMDGARLWNAAVATGRPVAELAAPFDMVWVAFSKALGAPAGAMLAGPADLIARATRYRRMSGGAMRQVGIFAAAAEYALVHQMDALAQDHLNARQIGEMLNHSSRISVDLDRVETNIIYFELADDAPPATEVVSAAANVGVRVLASGPRTIRIVTHRDVTTDQCREGARRLLEVVDA